MRRFGVRLAVASVLLLSGCLYGFAGGGLPPHIRTVAVLPFENETPAATLQRELHDRLSREIESRLGVRTAGEGSANAIVRGRILRYEADIPAAYSADPARANTAQRRLEIVVDIEIIDQTTGRPLWSRSGLRAEANYDERDEENGRVRAVEQIVNDVIAGAQSQW
jgi:hypothetical protein